MQSGSTKNTVHNYAATSTICFNGYLKSPVKVFAGLFPLFLGKGYKVNFKSKLPNVGNTVFSVMSQLAIEHNAINLGQGFPDFDMSPELIDLVNKAMTLGYNQYAPQAGLPVLRERLAEKIFDLYNTQINPETDITITPGGTYAIYTALTTVLQPGDEVIVFEPAYDSYIPNIEINGAIPVLIPLKFPDYTIPWNVVKDKITPATKMIMINSPHNPTGSVLSSDDMRQLTELVKGTDILILSDEVYEHLIFDGIAHESILKYPELLERSFVCFSFGKTFHCTGWKMGYCVSNPELMKEFRKVHQFNCFSVNSPAQHAIAEYLKNKDAYLQLGPFVQKKRDFFQHLMTQTPFTPIKSNGSYFQCYSYSGLSDESDKAFSVRLTKEYGVTTIPVSAFYKSEEDNKVIRFCFCKKEETLEKAAGKLIGFK